MVAKSADCSRFPLPVSGWLRCGPLQCLFCEARAWEMAPNKDDHLWWTKLRQVWKFSVWHWLAEKKVIPLNSKVFTPNQYSWGVKTLEQKCSKIKFFYTSDMTENSCWNLVSSSAVLSKIGRMFPRGEKNPNISTIHFSSMKHSDENIPYEWNWLTTHHFF